ncbi:MAG TPA: M1 family aminopeptidase [Holophagaceae bacterium]|nr:M1 family aminopeptidase [Holophagaceae bacterium]
MPWSPLLPIRRALRVLATLSAGLLAAQSPAPWFSQHEQFQLGPARQSPEVRTFSLGHAKFTFTGRWAPLLRGDREIGLFLEGKGELEYVSAYEPEGPVFSRNLKDATSLVTVPSGSTQTLRLPFTRARLLTPSGAPIPWVGVEASGLEEPRKAFEDRWRKVDGYRPSQLLASQAANAPDRPVGILELEGPDWNFLYRYDSVNSGVERLDLQRPFPKSLDALKGWSYLLPMSSQPLGRDPKKGGLLARFALSALDVDLRTEDNRQATVVVQERILPIQDGLRVLPFEFLSDIATGTDQRKLTLTRVTDAQGNALEFSHANDHLAVRLNGPAKAGEPLLLKFEYQGDFLVSPRGDNFWQLGVRGSWYPQPEHMAEESYLFHASVRTKGDWHAFLPGDTVRREKDGAWNLVETRSTQPICFATILGGKYFTEEETREGLTIRVASYAFKGGQALKVIKDQAFNVLRYYRNFLGPYPFKELTIVEKNEWGYGQAPPGMTYITREAFEQISNIRNMQEFADLVGEFGGRVSIQTMDVRHVLAHELAHQYWGTVVKMGSPEDQWITESFADYCAALYERDFKSQGHYNRNVAQWKRAATEVHEAGPIPLANEVRRKDGYEGFKIRTGLLYSKGPLLLTSLHQELGDQVFFTWLKSTQTNFRWKFAPTRRIFDLLGFITKKDYTVFYETYFWGTALPPVK